MDGAYRQATCNGVLNEAVESPMGSWGHAITAAYCSPIVSVHVLWTWDPNGKAAWAGADRGAEREFHRLGPSIFRPEGARPPRTPPLPCQSRISESALIGQMTSPAVGIGCTRLVFRTGGSQKSAEEQCPVEKRHAPFDVRL